MSTPLADRLRPQTIDDMVGQRHLLGENMPIQSVSVGDKVAVLTTGAYNYSMSSNYNRIPRPAMVMVNNGESKVIVKRETFEDLIKNDV